MEEIPDPVFSEGILGKGCGLEPAEETVCAPFNGTVTQVIDTKHAVGVTSKDGLELLIHVGMDTVAMNGEGFTCLVKEGDTVKLGQKLMTFSMEAIKAAGHPATTAVVVTNADDFADIQVLAQGEIAQGAPLLKASKYCPDTERQLRTIAPADLSGSFAPFLQFQKRQNIPPFLKR